jgi:hypothetical protein
MHADANLITTSSRPAALGLASMIHSPRMAWPSSVCASRWPMPGATKIGNITQRHDSLCMPRYVKTSEQSIPHTKHRFRGFALPVLFRKHMAAFSRDHVLLTSSCASDCMLCAASVVSPSLAHFSAAATLSQRSGDSCCTHWAHLCTRSDIQASISRPFHVVVSCSRIYSWYSCITSGVTSSGFLI